MGVSHLEVNLNQNFRQSDRDVILESEIQSGGGAHSTRYPVLGNEAQREPWEDGAQRLVLSFGL